MRSKSSLRDMPLIITKGIFENHLPPLSGDEYNALEKSLLEEGCREPLVTWQGILVDGHNRYEICRKHGISYTIREVDLPDEEAVKRWMINNQLSRRNLTDVQRERFIGMLYNAVKKDRGGTRGGAGRKSKAQVEPLKNGPGESHGGVDLKSKAQNEPLKNKQTDDGTNTAEQIAKKHGVSRETVKRAAQFDAALNRIGETSPEAVTKIMTGEAKITRSEVRNLANAPSEKIQSAAKAIVENKVASKQEKTSPKTAKPMTFAEHYGNVLSEHEKQVNVLKKSLKNMETAFCNDDLRAISERLGKLSSHIEGIQNIYIDKLNKDEKNTGPYSSKENKLEVGFYSDGEVRMIEMSQDFVGESPYELIEAFAAKYKISTDTALKIHSRCRASGAIPM